MTIDSVLDEPFTSFEGTSIEEEVIDYSERVTLEFSSDLSVSIIVRNPIIRPTNSFYLTFDVLQPGIGTSAYSLHWQSNEFEGIEFVNPNVVLLNHNQLSVGFGLISTLTIDKDTPLFTTEVSGDFTPVPVLSAVILGSLGLTFSGWMLNIKRLI